jgi:hypothetical protein
METDVFQDMIVPSGYALSSRTLLVGIGSAYSEDDNQLRQRGARHATRKRGGLLVARAGAQ